MIKNIHQLGLPISFENIIPDDDSVRLLYDVMEGLDYTKLNESYSTIGKNPAIEPESLFKILVYGYMKGIYSSRKLAKACRRDINFKWLLQGQKPPSHNTIARFRSIHLKDCIEELFSELVLGLKDQHAIEFKNVFIDGTKLEANANRYTFVWKKATDKFEEKLQNSMIKTLDDIIDINKIDIEVPTGKITVDYAKNILEYLNKIKEDEKWSIETRI